MPDVKRWSCWNVSRCAPLATAVVAFGLAICLLAGCRKATGPQQQVTIMQSEAPLTMDPMDHTASLTTDVLDTMYECLLRFDANLEVAPSLATAWSVDASGTRWTLQLRQGVVFHDGTPFQAEAVVAAFNRLLDQDRGLAGAGRVRAIVKHVSAAGPYTVIFDLFSSYAAFPRVLAVTWITSPLAEKEGKLSREAVGTGPYRFVEWKTGEYVLQERNEQYWGPRPAIKRLKWIWTTEPVLMNMSVLADAADIVNPLPPIFAEALSRNRKVKLMLGAESKVFWVALNLKSKPLDDIRVRQALNYATDREALVRTQLRGFGTPAQSPLAPADFAYDPHTKGYPYDLDRAKALLAKAGYPDGFSLRIAVQEPDAQIVEALQGMWALAHVKLEIQRMEHGVFSQAIFGSPAQKAQQGIDCVFASWASDNTDPDYQLDPLYRSDRWSPVSANLGFYANPHLDALLARAASELNSDKRKELYREAQQIISDDAPHVLLYYAQDVAAEHSGRVPVPVRILPGGRVDFEASGVLMQQNH